MRWAPVMLLVLAGRSLAQTPVDAGQLTHVLQEFEPHPGDAPLKCEVTPLSPALNFAFRFHAGYTFHVPLDQAPPPTQGWSVLTTITPDSDIPRPTYLLARHRLSDATKTDSTFDLRGLYFLGLGTYSVEATLRDEQNRICRKRWQIVVKASHADGAATSALPPHAVRGASLRSGPETLHPDEAPPVSVSVLMNAAAFSARRTAMRLSDRSILLGSLTALLEHVPTNSVRLIVFSLEQQREVLRNDNFTLSELNKVMDAVNTLQLATVDIGVLQKPLGHVDFLIALINRELDASSQPDRVVFLGPPSRYSDRIPENALWKGSGSNPEIFYIRCEGPRRPPFPSGVADNPNRPGTSPDGRAGGAGPIDTSSDTPVPPPLRSSPSNGNVGSAGGNGTGGGSGGRGGGGGRGRSGSGSPPVPFQAPQSDIIDGAVARLKGKVMAIHSPAELAKAIQRIEHR